RMMAYQPYYPGGWQPGPSGNTPISADALNHMERQYDEAMADLDAQKTTPGGTEPNRLAVTDDDGAVGLAGLARDAMLVQGRDIVRMIDGLFWSSLTSRSSGTTQGLWGIAYGDGMW